MALARVKHVLDLWGVDDPKVCFPGKCSYYKLLKSP